MQPAIDSLRHWELPGRAVFEIGAGGLPRLVVKSSIVAAHIYLHGAHITHFQPAGMSPVLFLSASSLFVPDKAIRGGVPVIFPWFGPRGSTIGAPVHGFARTMRWAVASVACDPDDSVTATFCLTASDVTRAQWPHDFTLRYRITVGTTLAMRLEVENKSAEPFPFEEALHTYLAVGDVRRVTLTGLAGTEFIDKVDHFTRKRQDDAPIRITGETDRVYLHTRSSCVLDDPSVDRQIIVEKSGSQTTVVWNPWMAKAAAMVDFGNEEWTKMLCVETANAGENAVTLAPGATHVMEAVVRVV
jgi:D-hexose-6-phosphate mutarotase